MSVHMDHLSNVRTHVVLNETEAGRGFNAMGRLSKYLHWQQLHYNYCPVVLHFMITKNAKKIERVEVSGIKICI